MSIQWYDGQIMPFQMMTLMIRMMCAEWNNSCVDVDGYEEEDDLDVDFTADVFYVSLW